jgi:RNA polymerase sigma-70 factor (ECF subfamily)
MPELHADSSETRSLLDNARSGERRAIDRLFHRHRRYVSRVVELRLDPRLRVRVDPSDVVQEAQLEAARRLPQYLAEPAVPFRLWLRQIAVDRLLMLHRKHLQSKRRTAARDLPLPDRSSVQLAHQLVARGPNPMEQLAARELTRRVRDALARLTEPDRELLILRNFEGLSLQEIACVLDIEPAAARKRHGRALLRLRKELIEDGLRESEL